MSTGDDYRRHGRIVRILTLAHIYQVSQRRQHMRICRAVAIAQHRASFSVDGINKINGFSVC